MTIVEYDFGKGKRRVVRRFRKSLSLDALHEHNIQANPLPYLERAAERIFQLEKALFEAAQVFASSACAGETVQVDKLEYDRLRRCRHLVEAALAEHASDHEL